MQRRAITTLLLGIFPLTLSLAACQQGDRRGTLEANQELVNQLNQIEQKIDANRLQPDDRVIIYVKRVGGSLEIDRVWPPEKDVCKPPEANCDAQVRWILAGPIGDWKIRGQEKESKEPTNCFQAFDLDQSTRVNTQSPAAPCQVTGMSWEYDVILTDAEGAEKDRVDPLVLVTWSPSP